MPTTAHQVWEKQAAHINLKLSQAGGGHPEVSHPPGRHAGGWGASPGPGLHQSATLSPSDVSVVLKNDTQAFGRAKTQMLFKVGRFKITTSTMISLNKQLI